MTAATNRSPTWVSLPTNSTPLASSMISRPSKPAQNAAGATGSWASKVTATSRTDMPAR